LITVQEITNFLYHSTVSGERGEAAYLKYNFTVITRSRASDRMLAPYFPENFQVRLFKAQISLMPYFFATIEISHQQREKFPVKQVKINM